MWAIEYLVRHEAGSAPVGYLAFIVSKRRVRCNAPFAAW